MDASVVRPHTGQLLDLSIGLGAVRATVERWATEAGLGPPRVAEVTLAVHEVAANAVRHGGGRGVVRLWRTADALLCEVEDSGPGIADPRAGLRAPRPEDTGGRGLWIARRLSEEVEIDSSGAGARVRLRLSPR